MRSSTTSRKSTPTRALRSAGGRTSPKSETLRLRIPRRSGVPGRRGRRLLRARAVNIRASRRYRRKCAVQRDDPIGHDALGEFALDARATFAPEASSEGSVLQEALEGGGQRLVVLRRD